MFWLVIIGLALVGFFLMPMLLSLIFFVYRVFGNALKGIVFLISVLLLAGMFLIFGWGGIVFGLLALPVIYGIVVFKLAKGTWNLCTRNRQVQETETYSVAAYGEVELDDWEY